MFCCCDPKTNMGSILTRIEERLYRIDRRFDRIDRRFDNLEAQVLQNNINLRVSAERLGRMRRLLDDMSIFISTGRRSHGTPARRITDYTDYDDNVWR